MLIGNARVEAKETGLPLAVCLRLPDSHLGLTDHFELSTSQLAVSAGA